ncbi:MAG: dipicolinate synthase subunit DpsA [Firmicutes bacterium]|nr:dipicolinate synthase subunit DpsA [Bacillota bacterium]
MGSALAGKRIAVLGGDARSFFYIPALIEEGAAVKAAGFDKAVDLVPCELVDLAEVLMWANVVILPMSGVASDGSIVAPYSDNGLVLTSEMCALTPAGLLVLTGVANAHLKELAAIYGWHLVEIVGNNELAILNSIPSAEGAIQMAMEASDITIHGSTSLVLGFGRCGTTIAKDLSGLGATVIIAARAAEDLARAKVCGYQAVDFSTLPEIIGTVDFIFNTAPALVLPRALLILTKPEVVIIDIASGLGGVDYAAARRLGRKALLAPSLPGKVAPRTAGRILGELLPRIIQQHSKGRDY